MQLVNIKTGGSIGFYKLEYEPMKDDEIVIYGSDGIKYSYVVVNRCIEVRDNTQFLVLYVEKIRTGWIRGDRT